MHQSLNSFKLPAVKFNITNVFKLNCLSNVFIFLIVLVKKKLICTHFEKKFCYINIADKNLSSSSIYDITYDTTKFLFKL